VPRGTYPEPHTYTPRLQNDAIPATAVLACVSVAAAIALPEAATSLPPGFRTWKIDSSAQLATITAANGAQLHAAYPQPSRSPHRPHGVGDHGSSMTGPLTAQATSFSPPTAAPMEAAAESASPMESSSAATLPLGSHRSTQNSTHPHLRLRSAPLRLNADSISQRVSAPSSPNARSPISLQSPTIVWLRWQRSLAHCSRRSSSPLSLDARLRHGFNFTITACSCFTAPHPSPSRAPPIRPSFSSTERKTGHSNQSTHAGSPRPRTQPSLSFGKREPRPTSTPGAPPDRNPSERRLAPWYATTTARLP
jgi:hypothetical protein